MEDAFTNVMTLFQKTVAKKQIWQSEVGQRSCKTFKNHSHSFLEIQIKAIGSDLKYLPQNPSECELSNISFFKRRKRKNLFRFLFFL